MGTICITGGGSSVDLDVISAGGGDIRQGKVIVDKDGNPLTGTLTDNGSWSKDSLAPGASIAIPAGIHDGTGKVTAQDLKSATAGTLASNKMLSGVYGYSNGEKVTGNIASQAAITLKPGTTAKTASISGKYMTGNVTCSAVSIAANVIKKGTKITFPDGSSVTGTWEGYVAAATDLYYKGNNAGGLKGYNNDSYCKAIFETTYIEVYTTTTSANSTTIIPNKSYNFSGYKNLIIEFNVITPYSRVSTHIDLRKSGSNTNLVTVKDPFTSTGSKSVSFSLTNYQTTFTPVLVFCCRTAKIQITRIRLA